MTLEGDNRNGLHCECLKVRVCAILKLLLQGLSGVTKIWLLLSKKKKSSIPCLGYYNSATLTSVPDTTQGQVGALFQEESSHIFLILHIPFKCAVLALERRLDLRPVLSVCSASYRLPVFFNPLLLVLQQTPKQMKGLIVFESFLGHLVCTIIYIIFLFCNNNVSLTVHCSTSCTRILRALHSMWF